MLAEAANGFPPLPFYLRMTGGLVAIRAKYNQLKQLEFVTRLPDRLCLFFCIVQTITRKSDVKECLC